MARRVDPDELFDCKALHCRLAMRCCAMRQAVSDAQRVRRKADLARGQAPTYPHCVTGLCPQGTRIRNRLDPARANAWQPRGLDGFERRSSDKVRQMAERARRILVGLLDEVPTVDTPPGPVPPGDDGPCPSEQRQISGQEEAAGRPPLPARQVGQPGRASEGAPRVPRAGPQAGDAGRPRAAPAQRDLGAAPRSQLGRGDPARLRVGEADAGRRADRQGRRAGRGLGCP